MDKVVLITDLLGMNSVDETALEMSAYDLVVTYLSFVESTLIGYHGVSCAKLMNTVER